MDVAAHCHFKANIEIICDKKKGAAEKAAPNMNS